jgi:RNA exonuclease NGL2
LVGEPLTPQQKRVIEESRVVHVSIDVSIQVDSSGIGDDELAVADPDRVITDSRPATDNDGLLSDEELANSFHVLGRLRSMYEEGQRQVKFPNVFGSRNDGFPLERKGYFEPQWTSYTHFWKSTLGNLK